MGKNGFCFLKKPRFLTLSFYSLEIVIFPAQCFLKRELNLLIRVFPAQLKKNNK